MGPFNLPNEVSEMKRFLTKPLLVVAACGAIAGGGAAAASAASSGSGSGSSGQSTTQSQAKPSPSTGNHRSGHMGGKHHCPNA